MNLEPIIQLSGESPPYKLVFKNVSGSVIKYEAVVRMISSYRTEMTSEGLRKVAVFKGFFIQKLHLMI